MFEDQVNDATVANMAMILGGADCVHIVLKGVPMFDRCMQVAMLHLSDLVDLFVRQ